MKQTVSDRELALWSTLAFVLMVTFEVLAALADIPWQGGVFFGSIVAVAGIAAWDAWMACWRARNRR